MVSRPSIQRYVIVETSGPALTVFSRQASGAEWAAVAVLAGETLSLPDVGIEIPVSETFSGVTFE